MKTYKLLLITLLSILFILGSFSVCFADQVKIPELQISTGSPTGGWFQIGALIAEWTNQKVEGYPITATPGAGGIGNPLRLAKGEADIGVSYGTFLIALREGTKPYENEPKNTDLRAMFSLTSNAHVFLVDKDIDATLVKDIIDKKIGLDFAIANPGDSGNFALEIILDGLGATYKDFKNWGGSVQEGLMTSERVNLWKDRHINGTYFMIPIGNADVVNAMASRPGKLLGLSEPIRDMMEEKWGYVKYEMPPGTYPNQDYPVAAVRMAMVFFTTKEASEEAIYLITKTVAESEQDLKASMAGFKNWTAENMIEGVGIPIHEGSLRYYRERGWIE